MVLSLVPLYVWWAASGLGACRSLLAALRGRVAGSPRSGEAAMLSTTLVESVTPHAAPSSMNRGAADFASVLLAASLRFALPKNQRTAAIRVQRAANQ